MCDDADPVLVVGPDQPLVGICRIGPDPPQDLFIGLGLRNFILPHQSAVLLEHDPLGLFVLVPGLESQLLLDVLESLFKGVG